jgi:hypothetical protein
MSNVETKRTRELAFYYPNPMWSYGNWIKDLVLFFDGIALLVPEHMKERPEELAAMTDIITSGVRASPGSPGRFA